MTLNPFATREHYFIMVMKTTLKLDVGRLYMFIITKNHKESYVKVLNYLAITCLLVLTATAPAHAKIKGLFSTARILTSPVAVSMGNQNGLTEIEARLKSKSNAEAIAHVLPDYTPNDREEYPYDQAVKAVSDLCQYSKKLKMEGEKITYDLYTSLVDGNTYVQAVLTFKYACPELSGPIAIGGYAP